MESITVCCLLICYSMFQNKETSDGLAKRAQTVIITFGRVGASRACQIINMSDLTCLINYTLQWLMVDSHRVARVPVEGRRISAGGSGSCVSAPLAEQDRTGVSPRRLHRSPRRCTCGNSNDVIWNTQPWPTIVRDDDIQTATPALYTYKADASTRHLWAPVQCAAAGQTDQLKRDRTAQRIRPSVERCWLVTDRCYPYAVTLHHCDHLFNWFFLQKLHFLWLSFFLRILKRALSI